MKAVLAAIVLSTSVVVWQNNAVACTCMPLPPVEESFKNTEAIFIGRVADFIPLEGPSWVNVLVTLKVEKVYKGQNIPKEIDLGTNSWTSACGFPFELNETYLVFAEKQQSGNRFITNMCSRTRLIKYATDDIKWLESHRP